MKKILMTIALAIAMISATTVKAGNLGNELQPVFKTYEIMVQSLAYSLPKDVKIQAGILQKEIKAVNTKSFSAENLAVWKKASAKMLEENKIIINDKSNSTNIQRISFAGTSKAFYEVLKASDGIPNLTIHCYFSKKADHGTGAYWFATPKVISNPYTGTKGNIGDAVLKATLK